MPTLRAPIDRFPFRLLRRHVGRGAEDDAGVRRRRARDSRGVGERGGCIARCGWSQRFRETEVEHLDRAVTPHLDVRRLQVAVNDPLLVRGFERLGDLLRDRQRFVDRDRATRDALGQVLALDQFHHERGDAAAFFEAVDGGDVRMVERGEHLGFALKSRQPVVVCRE